jgi:hypothetical protein
MLNIIVSVVGIIGTLKVPTQIPSDQPNSFKTEGEIALSTGIL